VSAPPYDPWFRLARWTKARIGLGRVGASLPTREVLSFALAHAQARDAVHARLDRDALRETLAGHGLDVINVDSEATDRQVYLRRPDLGRKLSGHSRLLLADVAGQCDLVFVVGDGLSATAVNAHLNAFISAFLPYMARLELKLAPVVIAEGARVALGDEIGAILGARAVAVVIGERPGLTAADSLGIYLTYEPRPGRHDGERNCISNVRPDGLPPDAAAARLAWLINAALTRQLTGIGLNDESDILMVSEHGAAPESLRPSKVAR
jgi:ethanolamine ammonia-lyase small subunit